jgi:putative transcriptional regulator
MIKYKIDILEALKAAGYNQTLIQKERLLPNSVLDHLRKQKNITLDTIDKICVMTHLQPGDMFEFVLTEEDVSKYSYLFEKTKKKD